MTTPEIHLDVSQLEPPEPLQRILARLPQLPPGHFLHVRHRREPVPLFDLLRQHDFAYRVLQDGEGAFHILIWPCADTRAEALCQHYVLP